MGFCEDENQTRLPRHSSRRLISQFVVNQNQIDCIQWIALRSKWMSPYFVENWIWSVHSSIDWPNCIGVSWTKAPRRKICKINDHNVHHWILISNLGRSNVLCDLSLSRLELQEMRNTSTGERNAKHKFAMCHCHCTNVFVRFDDDISTPSSGWNLTTAHLSFVAAACEFDSKYFANLWTIYWLALQRSGRWRRFAFLSYWNINAHITINAMNVQ